MNNTWEWQSFTLFLFVFFISVFLLSRSIVRCEGTQNSKYKIFSALLPPLLLLALRAESIGQDLVRYKAGYLNLQYINFSFSWIVNYLFKREPIYVAINIIVGKISNWNFQLLIITITIIQFIFIYKTLYKQKLKNINIVIELAFFLCFIYVRSFSMVRQGIALAIMLYSYTLLEEKKYKKYWMYSGLAIGIHYTALISILIYFWAKDDKVKVLKRIGMIIIFGLVLVFGQDFFVSIFTMMGSKYAQMQFKSHFGLGNFLARLPLLIIIICKSKAMKKEIPGISTYINIFYLDIIIAQFKYINVQFERLTMYTFMSLLFILPALYKVLKKKHCIEVNVIYVIIFISWFIYEIYYYTYINPYNIMPYKFFW